MSIAAGAHQTLRLQDIIQSLAEPFHFGDHGGLSMCKCNGALSEFLHDRDAVSVIVEYPENWWRRDIRPAVTVEVGVEEATRS